jgi:hypothetical protein
MAVGCEVANWTFGVGVAVGLALSMLRRLLVVLTYCLSESVCASVEGAIRGPWTASRAHYDQSHREIHSETIIAHEGSQCVCRTPEG